MADSKISGLPSVTITATDEIPVVQSGVTSKDTIQGILDLVSSDNLGTADLTIELDPFNFLLTALS